MKTVYDLIQENNRKTIWLVLLFPIILSALIYLFIYLNTVLTFSPNFDSPYGFRTPLQLTNDTALIVIPIVLFISIVWLIISFYRGDKMLLRAAGSYEISKRDNPVVFRLVENLAIASGLPMPKIFIIPDESLNAFATGRDPEHSAIALTTGIIKKLNKMELEAVIAHEMAHIQNRDIRLMVLTIAGIGFVTILGHILIRTRGGGRNNGGGIIVILGLVFLIFGYILAPLLRFAISREREYLADASGAFTIRNPEAMASALRKISVDARVENLDKTPEMSAMCIANPLDKRKTAAKFLSGLSSTHPPIEDRIARLMNMTGEKPL